jgi:hypothetical protein
MRYGIFVLALGLVWSSQASAGEFQSVYVAPGGVYIASADVHVGVGNGYPTYGAPGAAYYGPYDTAPAYAPGYVPSGPIYRAPTFYEGEGYGSVYPTRRAYIDQSYMHAEEVPPRPPAPVPYNNRASCGFNQAYGRSGYCD